jgi:hypothetical protein
MQRIYRVPALLLRPLLFLGKKVAVTRIISPRV